MPTKRRGPGEGSYRQRLDGRWECRITIQGRQRSVYAKTFKECQRKVADAKRRAEQGLPVADERLTVSRFLDDWLASAGKSVRPRTLTRYELDVRRHIKPVLGNIKLTKLTPRLVQNLLNQKLEEGLSPASVRHLRAVLSRSLGQAERWGLIARNPARLVSSPRQKRPEIRALSTEEVKQFLDALGEDHWQSFYLVLLMGLRISEALGLRWQNLDFEKQTLSITHQLQWNRGGGWELVEPKTEQSRRTLRLPEAVTGALRAHRRRQLEDKLISGSKWQENNLVFPSAIGTPNKRENIHRRSFKPLLIRSGLPDIRFHDLRHTTGTFLTLQGVPPRVIMAKLGHSQLSTTMAYSHILPAMQEEVAEKMGGLFQRKKATVESG